MFKIEMWPAGHGDSLYIEYGEPSAPRRVLIDAGPYYAFKELAKRIDALTNSGVTLELLVITHVDGDHIDGAVKLLGAPPSGLAIQDVWFNAWRHLAPQPSDLLGPVQGEMLSALIQRRKLPWNAAFGGGRVALAGRGALPVITLPGGLRLTLLSPTRRELANLQPVWAKELRKAGLEPDSREQALAKLRKDARLRPPADLLGGGRADVQALAARPFSDDSSEANASSIAFLAEYAGARVLFTGDAHAPVLEAAIRKLVTRNKPKLKLDAVKLSHHGSKVNTSPSLLNLLDCKRFLVSTNGNTFNHPDPETIARIIVQSGPEVELFFNYLSDETRPWNDEYLQGRYNYQTHYPAETEGLSIEL